ncbi:hypothetical protein ES708_24331 [subsurface metagenome]
MVGDTDCVPLLSTSPIPWSMVTVVAPVTLQDKVADSPDMISVGLALNSVMTGGAETDG